MNTKIPNIEVIRSVWHRVKKDIKVRDLKPVKHVKGGGCVKGESKPITGGTGTADTTMIRQTCRSHGGKSAAPPLQRRPTADTASGSFAISSRKSSAVRSTLHLRPAVFAAKSRFL